MQTTGAADPLFLAFQQALAGRYSILHEAGRGGMGVVYVAREVHLDRVVAIKLLPPERAQRRELRDRFVREARIAAKLSHPHIIPIHAVDQIDGFVFFVMSYVEGETLSERIRARGPVSASDGVRILREVAWALAYAHAQGVVHRDVKPDNILIEAMTGRALVTDFGIAAVIGDGDSDGVSGTPEYMSPEQALGATVSAQSDLYGLGATAFYAFAGRPPFEGRSAEEILARQVTEPPPPLASLGLAVPRKLASLIDQCLAKDAASRPAGAESLAEQIGRTIDQQRPLPAALRAFVRRNGRMDGGGTLLYATGLLTTSISSSWLLGMHGAFATLTVGLAVAPIGFAILAARRLLRLGFAHADLGPAFRAELESGREERAVERGRHRVFESAVSWVARVSASFSIVAAPAIAVGLPIPGSAPVATAAIPVTLATVVVAIVSGLAHLAILQSRRDVDTEFWSRLWTGRLGTFAFGVARKLRGAQPVGPAMTHRATELSLGMAAEQLYQSLPQEARKALGDLPALLERLQHAAQQLRGRYDDLSAAVDCQRASDASHELDALRDERALVHDKLTGAVGALETIRLNLLRLHAGSAAVEGLTTHIGIAEEVSAEIERMVAAREDVDATLRFPRSLKPTPV